MSFRLNPNHVILLALTSDKVTSLAFSKVHSAALATHAFKDLHRMNLVLAVDSSLVRDTSYVESMKRVTLSIKKYLNN